MRKEPALFRAGFPIYEQLLTVKLVGLIAGR
jgi:hypothetical protein